MRLSDAVRARSRYARSTNLERDGDTLALVDYLPTARAHDLVRRVSMAVADRDRARSWSVSGPYGSGKSSVALLLDAILGPESSPARLSAGDLIQLADPELAERVAEARRTLGTPERGVLRAVITATPELCTSAVLRAVERGIGRYWPRGPKPAAARAIADAKARFESGQALPPQEVVSLLADLSSHTPILLVIDEFGKNLEFLRQVSLESDLYVMQAIAEASSGKAGLPLFMMTLQHLSFDAYTATAASGQRREWAKIQGRFEDVLFLDSPEQTIKLIAQVFEAVNSTSQVAKRIQSETKKVAAAARAVGLSDLVGGESTLVRTYPLHPTVLAVLPELCRRYGQNERTLFSFLSHDEPHAVGEFIEITELAARGPMPYVRLADVFDYFVGSVTPTLGVSPESARWFEIHERISQTIGLDDAEVAAVKTIGVLNLVAQGGALRASRALLAYALGSPDAEPDFSGLDELVAGLERRGFVTYRAFVDEYRLWQGSDFDLEGRIAVARERYDTVSTPALIEMLVNLTPVVASRYSQERGIVRTFRRRIAESLESVLVAQDDRSNSSDGTIVYLLSAAATKQIRRAADEPPLLVIEAPQLVALRETLVEAAAATDVLAASDDIDWVAKRELAERAGQVAGTVQASLEALLQTADVAFLLGPEGLERMPETRTVSELASTVCDRAYRSAPTVRNEMLARETLTSQAARARLDLLSAMVAAPDHPALGIEGYGPDRAMYEAILARSGIHSKVDDRWAFRSPPKKDGYQAAWDRVGDLMRRSARQLISVADVEAALRKPPVGVKAPLFPILLTAYLLAEPDQIAIYQDDVFQPRLTSDLLERLTKAPERFQLRYVSVEGDRLVALRSLATEFGLVIRSMTRTRTAPVLSVVAPLLEIVHQLPEYSLRTAKLSATASAVREAFLSAREPDQLLFEQLPTALSFPPLSSGRKLDAKAFASAVRHSLQEMNEAYPQLLGRISETIGTAIALDSRNMLKVEAAARARPLLRQVADPRLRALLFAMSSDTLDDDDWLEAVGLAISERPPQAWQAVDEDRFAANASSLFGGFRRVEAMYFDGRADSPAGFSPRRITVTAPDGSELSRVVWVDEAQRPLLQRLLEETRARIAEELPSLGDEALLATFAEQVLSTTSAGSDGRTVVPTIQDEHRQDRVS